MSSESEFRVLFLLGAMRSGTTFFRNVLASSKSVLTLGSELNEFWTEMGNAPCGAVECCPSRFGEDATPELIQGVRGYFRHHYDHRNSLIKLAYRSYRKLKFGNETLLKTGRPFYLLNKSTHLLNKVEFISAIFPQSRYIFLVRDIYSHSNSLARHFAGLPGLFPSYPRSEGECWSFTKNGVSGTVEFSDYPYYWIEQNALAMRSLDRLDANRVLYVNFEDINSNFSHSVEQCSAFLGVDYALQEIDESLVNNTTTSPLGSWKTDLSEKKITTIDQVVVENQDEYNFIQSHLSQTPQSCG